MQTELHSLRSTVSLSCKRLHLPMGKYVQSVKGNIKGIFLDDVPLLSAFFDPGRIPERGQHGFLEYGSKQVEQLAKPYFSSEEEQ